MGKKAEGIIRRLVSSLRSRLSKDRNNRCEYKSSYNKQSVFDTPGNFRCIRPVWRDSDKCIWHADDIENKDSETLEKKRLKVEDWNAEQITEVGKENGVFERERLDEVNLKGLKLGDDLSFRHCTLANANLESANLKGADLSGANLYNADFNKGYFNDCDFSAANLHKANFREASLHRTDFTRVELGQADLIDAELFSATLDDARLMRAELRDADLTQADLERAKLRNADLEGVQLSRSNAQSAFIEDANLTRVNILGANFEQTMLHNAVLSDIQIDRSTDISEGYTTELTHEQRFVLTVTMILYENGNIGYKDIPGDDMERKETRIFDTEIKWENENDCEYDEASDRLYKLPVKNLVQDVEVLDEIKSADVEYDECRVTGVKESLREFSNETDNGEDSSVDINIQSVRETMTVLESLQLLTTAKIKFEDTDADETGGDTEEVTLLSSSIFECVRNLDSLVKRWSGWVRDPATLVSTLQSLFTPKAGECENSSKIIVERGYVPTERAYSLLEREISEQPPVPLDGNIPSVEDKAVWMNRRLERVYRNNGLSALARRHFIKRKDIRRAEYHPGIPLVGRLEEESEKINESIRRKYSQLKQKCGIVREKIQQGAQWVADLLQWGRAYAASISMRYGESPYRVIMVSIVVIVLSAGFYAWLGLSTDPNSQDAELVYGAPNVTGSELALKTLYFSTLTFTTVNYGDLQPVNGSQMIAAVESFVGALLMALLVFVLGRRATR